MSTRCLIGMYNEDNNKIDYTYCHNDGEPDYTGNMLYKYYNNVDRVKELISLGKLSSLEPKLYPIKNDYTSHSFARPQIKVSIFYHRDRNDLWKYSKPSSCDTLENYIKCGIDSYAEYLYLFHNGNWYFIEDDEKPKHLASYLLKMDNINNIQRLQKESCTEFINTILSSNEMQLLINSLSNLSIDDEDFIIYKVRYNKNILNKLSNKVTYNCDIVTYWEVEEFLENEYKKIYSDTFQMLITSIETNFKITLSETEKRIIEDKYIFNIPIWKYCDELKKIKSSL